MRWTLMRCYEQCDCCGEKIRFWDDVILHGVDESHTAYAHRQCYIAYLNCNTEIVRLEVICKSYKQTIDKLTISLHDSYNEMAVLTANKASIKKSLRKNRK